MAYEKQTWVTGEVITKEKLNHMEDGIANSSSGTNTEIIKLGTVNMGGGTIGGAVYSFSGSMSTDNNKTIGEIIGDKTIIATMLVVDSARNEDNAIIEIAHTVLCIPNSTEKNAYKNRELLYVQHEPETRELVQLSVHALITSGADQSGLSASVYAMCI